MARNHLTTDAVPFGYDQVCGTDCHEYETITESDESSSFLNNNDALSDLVINGISQQSSSASSSGTNSDSTPISIRNSSTCLSSSGTMTNSNNSCSSNSVPYRTFTNSSNSCYRGSCSTSSRNTNFTSRSSSQELENERRLWMVHEDLGFCIPNEAPYKDIWARIAMTLYEKIIDWEEEQLNDYKDNYWDACLIHTKHAIDLEIAKEFLKILELEGLKATSIMNSDVGENCLQVAENIIGNSNKIFVLCSPAFHTAGLHKPCYYEVLMEKLTCSEWKKNLIPLIPSADDIEQFKNEMNLERCVIKRPFGCSAIVGITMAERQNLVESLRKNALSFKVQNKGEAKRRRARDNFEFSLKIRKNRKFADLRRGLEEFYIKLSTRENTENLLFHLCSELENMANLPNLDTDENRQNIFLDNCNGISIGPAFNFNFHPDNQ